MEEEHMLKTKLQINHSEISSNKFTRIELQVKTHTDSSEKFYFKGSYGGYELTITADD